MSDIGTDNFHFSVNLKLLLVLLYRVIRFTFLVGMAIFLPLFLIVEYIILTRLWQILEFLRYKNSCAQLRINSGQKVEHFLSIHEFILYHF